jgi:hypothetical protein
MRSAKYLMIFSLCIRMGLVLPGYGSEPTQFEYRPGRDGIIITGYKGDEKAVVIPGVIDGQRVIAIGDWAFANNGLMSLSIPPALPPSGMLRLPGTT